jgi:hypothetical protein
MFIKYWNHKFLDHISLSLRLGRPMLTILHPTLGVDLIFSENVKTVVPWHAVTEIF